MTEEVKYSYKVKPGKTFGAKSEYKAGDVVELTEAEAEGFLDKLELTDERPKKVTAKKTAKKEEK